MHAPTDYRMDGINSVRARFPRPQSRNADYFRVIYGQNPDYDVSDLVDASHFE
jgi:hypothetical protein